MNISVVATSHRENSQSKRISEIVSSKLIAIDQSIKPSVIDLAALKFPFWSPEKKKAVGIWGDAWNNVSNTLNNSSGFVVVVPEYGGMATPQAKNLFLLCDKGELSHKPGLIIAISSGTGGAYPISELRSSSYKNTHIMWIPENVIIRSVEQFIPGMHGNDIPDWMDERLDYCLKILLAYSENMKPLSNLINRKDFGNGM